ncbi:hypothetical protein D9M72_602200 [compost metagenome]
MAARGQYEHTVDPVERAAITRAVVIVEGDRFGARDRRCLARRGLDALTLCDQCVDHYAADRAICCEHQNLACHIRLLGIIKKPC